MLWLGAACHEQTTHGSVGEGDGRAACLRRVGLLQMKHGDVGARVGERVLERRIRAQSKEACAQLDVQSRQLAVRAEPLKLVAHRDEAKVDERRGTEGGGLVGRRDERFGHCRRRQLRLAQLAQPVQRARRRGRRRGGGRRCAGLRKACGEAQQAEGAAAAGERLDVELLGVHVLEQRAERRTGRVADVGRRERDAQHATVDELGFADGAVGEGLDEGGAAARLEDQAVRAQRARWQLEEHVRVPPAREQRRAETHHVGREARRLHLDGGRWWQRWRRRRHGERWIVRGHCGWHRLHLGCAVGRKRVGGIVGRKRVGARRGQHGPRHRRHLEGERGGQCVRRNVRRHHRRQGLTYTDLGGGFAQPRGRVRRSELVARVDLDTTALVVVEGI
jgi:hypothetical protein